MAPLKNLAGDISNARWRAHPRAADDLTRLRFQFLAAGTTAKHPSTSA